MQLKQKLYALPKYGIAASFLALEVFAFIGFSFGTNFVAYGALSLALAVILVLFSLQEIKKKGFTDIIFLLFPLLVFGLITAVGKYVSGHTYLGDYSVADQIFIPIALFSTGLCGCLLALNKTFKIKTFLIVIYGAFTLLVVINLLANLINFGPFYTIIYKGYYMYYAGKRSSIPVNEMAYSLEGFKFIEVKMSHYVLYPALLLTSVFMLFKVSFRNNRKTFITFASYTVIALISLIIVPSILGGIAVLFVAMIAGIMFLYYKVPNSRKPLVLVMKISIGLFLFVFLVMLLNNQSFASGISNLIAGNSFLNKLFNTNPIVSKYNIMLKDVIGINCLGFVTYQQGALTPTLISSSGSIFFDTFMTGGIVGVGLMAFLAIFTLRNFKKFFEYKDIEDNSKATLLGFIIFYFLFASLFYDAEYGVYYYFNVPYFMSGPFLIVIFVFAYVFAHKYLKKPETQPEVIKKEVTNNAVA